MVHLTDSPLRTEEAIVINSDNFTASSEPFFLVSPWKHIRNFPYSTWDGIGFAIIDNGYAGRNRFYQYNPNTDLWNDSWTEISDFPISIANGIGFSINNIGYAGLGTTGQNENRDIYAYDPIHNTWNWVASYPSIFTRECIVFTIAEKVYIGTGTNQPNPGGYPSPDNAFYEFAPQYLRENYQQ